MFCAYISSSFSRSFTSSLLNGVCIVLHLAYDFDLHEYIIAVNKLVNPNLELKDTTICFLTSLLKTFDWNVQGELKKYMELESHKFINRETRYRLRKNTIPLIPKQKLALEYLLKEILELGAIYAKNKIKINHIWEGIMKDEELRTIVKFF